MIAKKSLGSNTGIVKIKGNAIVAMPSTERALQFLKEMYVGVNGFINIVAIDPNSPAITAKSAATSNIGTLAKFIASFNGKWNLYFSLNPLRTRLNSKAAKSDVRGLLFLHADIDPRADQPFDTERKRILAKIEGCPVQPSIVIDSGGGYQPIWRLKVCAPVKGNIAELEQHNQRLKQYFGADKCWNIDRVMRLPYTWNLPDEIKRKKGRKKAVANVVDFNDAAFDLSDFDWLPPAPAVATATATVVEPGEIPARFWDLLPHEPKLKARWEGNTAGLSDASRSGLDMALAGMLWERDFKKEEIAAILLAYQFGKAKEQGAGASYLSTTLSKLGDHSTKKNAAPLNSSELPPTLVPFIYWGEEIKAIPASPVEYAVTPLFQMGAIHGLYAEKGAGKTYFMLEGGLSIALGKRFLKWLVPHPRRVLYVDGEMGAAEMKDRLQLMTPTIPANLGLLSVDYLRSLDINVNIAQEKVRNAISATLKAYEDAGEKIEVLILDNLFSLAFGIDLKDAVDFDPIREWFLQLKAKGLCIILLDHENRAGGFFGTVSKIVNAAMILHLKKEGEAFLPGWTRLSVEVEYARSFPADQGRLTCEFGTCKTLHGLATIWDWDSKSSGGPQVPPHIKTLFHIHATTPSKVEQIEQATGKARSTVQAHLSTLRKVGWLSKIGYTVTSTGMAMIKQHYPVAGLGAGV